MILWVTMILYYSLIILGNLQTYSFNLTIAEKDAETSRLKLEGEAKGCMIQSLRNEIVKLLSVIERAEVVSILVCKGYLDKMVISFPDSSLGMKRGSVALSRSKHALL